VQLFLQALVYKSKAAEKSNRAYRNVSSPKLRYINLDCADFGADIVGTIPGSVSVDILLDYLMERYERKAAVRLLRPVNCYYITSDDIERLKEIVVDVYWDGLEQESSTDSEEDTDFSSSSYGSYLLW
jgi:hypothetical protein